MTRLESSPAPAEGPTEASRGRRSRRRTWVVFGLLALVVAVYLYRQFNPGSPPPRRSAADSRMVAEAERLGGSVRSQRIDGGWFGLGGGEMIVLEFRGVPIDDDGLGRLARASGDGPTALRLLDTKVTDAGLRHLKGMRRLGVLTVGSQRPGPGPAPAITDAALADLAGLPGLNTLELPGSAVTGSGFGALERARFGALSLEGSKVDDAAIARLASARPGLVSLNLDNTAITDEALKAIAGLSDLKSLSIAGTSVTSAGFKDLAPLRNLSMLTISFGPSSRPGDLKDLAGLSGLRQLIVQGDGYMTGDFDEIRDALPNLSILLSTKGRILPSRIDDAARRDPRTIPRKF